METVDKDCKHKDCAYRMRLAPSGGGKTQICAYCMYTGHTRGCKISECDKYVKGKRKMRHGGNDGLMIYEVEEDK